MSDELFIAPFEELYTDEIDVDTATKGIKDYLDVTFLLPHSLSVLCTAGFAACFINDNLLLKRHLSGTFHLTHKGDIFAPGGYVVDWNNVVDTIRGVMKEEVPERKFSIEYPIDRTPFWIKKYGATDITTYYPEGDLEAVRELSGFTVLEARYGDRVVAYPIVPMLIIDMMYRLKNLKPHEEKYIFESMMLANRKRKQGFKTSYDLFNQQNQKSIILPG